MNCFPNQESDSSHAAACRAAEVIVNHFDAGKRVTPGYFNQVVLPPLTLEVHACHFIVSRLQALSGMALRPVRRSNPTASHPRRTANHNVATRQASVIRRASATE